MSYTQSGITGNLVSAQLSDLMQGFEKHRQSGTLHIGPEEQGIKIFIRNGAVYGCSSPLVDGMPFLLHTALRRGIITAAQVSDVTSIVAATGQSLRQVISRARICPDAEIDMIAEFCIEERIYPLFQKTEGFFSFQETDPGASLASEAHVHLKDRTLRISTIIMEAARRNDEWAKMRSVVDSNALYVVDRKTNATTLREFETSHPEAGVVAKYLDGKHTLSAVACKTGVGLFDIHVFLTELIRDGLARIQHPQDVVADAVLLQNEGAVMQACELLETLLISHRIEEVLRPLAAIYEGLNRHADAVAIFYELAQASYDRGLLQNALQDVDTAIVITPENPDLHFLRARICTDLGDQEGAAAGYRFVAEAKRSAPPEVKPPLPEAGPVTDSKRHTNPHGQVEHPITDTHINRQTGHYTMGSLPKTKTDPLIPAPPSGDETGQHGNDARLSVGALSAEDITLMFKTNRLHPHLINAIKNQLQKILPESSANLIVFQAMSDAKNILDFQRNIDGHVQREPKGPIIMAVINETLLDACRTSGSSIVTAPQPANERPTTESVKPKTGSISTAIPPKDLDLIKTALLHCMGPIANVLVKRHATTAKSTRALIEGLEEEINDETTRATFRNAVKKQSLI